jgi:hypothetical protein
MVEEEGNTDEKSSGGHARLKVQLAEGRAVYVGAFANMVEATSWGRALAKCKKLGLKSVKVEHKNRGCWKPAKVLMLTVCLALLGIAGCATSPPPPADIADAYEEDRAAALRVCAHLRREPCTLDRIRVVQPRGDLAGAVVPGTGQIVMVRTVYQKEHEALRRLVLAHEFSHVILKHYDGRCRDVGSVERYLCELQADVHSVSVLEWGWGMERDEAVRAVYAKLTGNAGAGASGGHLPGCLEILGFYNQFSKVVPLAAPEKCGR